MTGQEVGLHKQSPIVASSPTDKFDFALLRTQQVAAGINDVKCASFAISEPILRSAMHILQHPRGGPMKLALSDNGVAAINSTSGRIQYVTRTAGGSSGSPCFDADWNLVAIHHAEVAKSFGSIREGILMKPIFELIRQHLST